MKRLNFVLLAVIISCSYSFSQKNKEQLKYQKIKVIEWDFFTKTYINDSVYKSLKVNEIVRFKLINLPKNCTLASSATFSNNNLERREDFGNLIKFDKSSEYTNLVNEKETEKKTKTNLENKTKETEKNTFAIIKAFEFDKKYNSTPLELQKNKLIEQNPKVNEFSLSKDLEVNDALNFVNAKKGNETALLDLKWQKYLINIAQKNWHNQLHFRDSLLNNYAIDIDKLNSKVAAQNKEIDSLSSRSKYSTTPLKIENFDYTTFNFTISDKDGFNETNLNVPFKNYNGFKIDFSTGILVNGLFSPSYKIITNPDDSTKKQIVEESDTSSKFNTGIALMAHAYSRWGEFVNLGIGSGFSYNLNQQNLNFLLGGSFLFGAEQRFITTVGINLGKVKQLSSYYEINKDYNSAEFTTNSTVPTIEVLKASWFISITYNLGIGNPSKTKKI